MIGGLTPNQSLIEWSFPALHGNLIPQSSTFIGVFSTVPVDCILMSLLLLLGERCCHPHRGWWVSKNGGTSKSSYLMGSSQTIHLGVPPIFGGTPLFCCDGMGCIMYRPRWQTRVTDHHAYFFFWGRSMVGILYWHKNIYIHRYIFWPKLITTGYCSQYPHSGWKAHAFRGRIPWLFWHVLGPFDLSTFRHVPVVPQRVVWSQRPTRLGRTSAAKCPWPQSWSSRVCSTRRGLLESAGCPLQPIYVMKTWENSVRWFMVRC